MNDHDHTLSPGCWCDPIVAHVQGGRMIVSTPEEAARLAELGITREVVVNPSVPEQRGGE